MLGSFNSGTLGFGVVLRAKDAFSREFAKFRKELSLTGIAVDRFERQTRNAGAKLAALGGLSIGLRGAGQLMKDLSNVAGEYEQIETAIKSIAGGELIGGKLIDDLRQYTLESPLGFEDLVKNAKKLLAHGIPVSNVMDDLKMLTELSAGVGLDKFPFLALAYGQSMAGGRATGQENLQFVNAGIGIRKEVAKLYKDQGGAAMSAAAKELKAEDVKKALYNLTKEGGKFHNLINSQMQTFKGLMSVLADSMYFLKVEMGTVINERYKGILKSMTLLAEQFVTFLLSDRGKGTILTFLKFFEVMAIGTLIATLFAGTKFLLYMTGFLLPQATKQTFMLAVMNNRLGRAFGVLFRSVFKLRFAFYNIVLSLAMIGAGVFVLHRAFQSLFHTDYIKRFMLILTTFFELIRNYKTLVSKDDKNGFMIGGNSTLSAETVNKLYANPGTAKFAIGLFVIYADIKRMVFGIAQGMFAVLEVAYNIASAIGNAIKSLLLFFGIISDDTGQQDVLGTFGFMNDKLITDIGRFIGVFLGIKIVYKILKQIIDAYRILKKVLRTIRPTNLRRMFVTSRLGRLIHRFTKEGTLLSNVFKEIGYALNSVGRKMKDFTKSTWQLIKAFFRLTRMRIRSNLRRTFNPRHGDILSNRQVYWQSRFEWLRRKFRDFRINFRQTGLGRLMKRFTNLFRLSARTRVRMRRLGRNMRKGFRDARQSLRGLVTAMKSYTWVQRTAIVAQKVLNWVSRKGFNSIFKKLILFPAMILLIFSLLKVGLQRIADWVKNKFPWLAGWFGMTEEDVKAEEEATKKKDEETGTTRKKVPAGSKESTGGKFFDKKTGTWKIMPMPVKSVTTMGEGKPTTKPGEGTVTEAPKIDVYLDGDKVGKGVMKAMKKKEEAGL